MNKQLVAPQNGHSMKLSRPGNSTPEVLTSSQGVHVDTLAKDLSKNRQIQGEKRIND